ncbi:hypothetical protein O3G_MSEX014304 [Manduca sexta]|uniref:Uncharacterized protein n=1 Tax=Manduca sexta TaxID=7130 RepID=A0A921ZU19_MANSE|nr:hypothetical protein O3G_MSEX014304 [Manduca sexta]
MNKPVSKVVKSKSSNSAVCTKTDKNNKKSRSNAEFQPNVLKKRGMYVEKKATKTSINDTVAPPKQKAPPRPRPGSKRFLTSVLTILSKSTTGTQHPELNDAKSTRKNNPDATVEKRAKRKFKSRILNDRLDDKLIVLQSTKDMVNTPSIYSERSQDTMSRITKSEIQKMDKAIEVDVKKRRKDKKVTIDEPVTLVQDKKDPGLYNFFVDLLQTTFSACNMNPNTELKKPSNSKIDLAINESVAKKLNVIKEKEPFKVTEKVSDFCCLGQDNWSVDEIKDTPPPIRFSKIDLLPKPRYKKKTESLSTKAMVPKVYSGLFPTKKSYTAKNKKKIVLNLLKRQLKMETESFVEPQNIYQALRNIARNKRKYQKSIRFTKVDNSDECIFKQKKIISASKSKKRIDKESKFMRIDSNFKKLKEFTSEESLHSLEVFDYDYEIDQRRRKEKKIFYARPSFISIDQSRLNEDLIQMTEDYGLYGM